MLRYLRQHGNYLTPGEGITLTSVIVVLLRGMILNLLVWIPIAAAVMWPDLAVGTPRAGPSCGGWPVTNSRARSTQRNGRRRGWQIRGDISPPPPTEAAFVAPHDLPTSGAEEQDQRPKAFTRRIKAARGSPKLFLRRHAGGRDLPVLPGCVLAFAMYSLVTWLGSKSSRFFLGGTKYGWRRQFER